MKPVTEGWLGAAKSASDYTRWQLMNVSLRKPIFSSSTLRPNPCIKVPTNFLYLEHLTQHFGSLL